MAYPPAGAEARTLRRAPSQARAVAESPTRPQSTKTGKKRNFGAIKSRLAGAREARDLSEADEVSRVDSALRAASGDAPSQAKTIFLKKRNFGANTL